MRGKILSVIVLACLISVWINGSNNILYSNIPKWKYENQILNSDTVLLYNNGYTSLKNKDFLEYLRNHIIISPSKQPMNLTNPKKKDFSQIGQSR